LFGEKVHGQYNQNVFDGRTLTPILFEELPMPERTLFWRKGKEWAIRRGCWKLIGDDKSEIMLFNLDEDIREQKDLAKEKPDLVKELLVIYKEWEKDIAGKS
jgi:arylsulfatase A-like enzyme